MLDGGYAGSGCDLDARGAVAMRGDGQTVGVGRSRYLAQGLQVELGGQRIGPVGHPPARGHDFDEVHTLAHLALQHGQGLTGGSRFPAPEVAVTAGTRDGLPGAEQPGPDGLAGRRSIPDAELEPRTAAEVAGSGDARPDHGRRPLQHPRHLVWARRLRGLVVVGIEFQVDVGVDEPRERRGTRAADEHGVSAEVLGVAYRRDASVFDADGIGVAKRLPIPDAADGNRGWRLVHE